MSDQFFSCIPGSPQSSDHACFFPDCIADRDSKYKRNDHNDHIEEHCDHCTVTPHIITGKCNCLVQILWHKRLQSDFFPQCFHQIFRHLFFLFFIFRFFVIHPGITVLNLILIQRFKLFRCYNRYPEFDCIKHTVIIVLEQAAIVRQCHKSCDFPLL